MHSLQEELEFLAAQAGTGEIHAIQRLSPAQLAALAAALGRRHGVKIAFGDFSTAATDGKTISLPLASRENSWAVRGYLDHEIAHLRLTDFSMIPNRSAFRKTLWNVIEDIRIEAFMPLHYPGMASNYRALLRELRKTSPGIFKIDPGCPPDVIIAAYINLVLRAMYLRQAEAADAALQARNAFIAVFGDVLEADLYRVISKIDQVSSPQHVVDLVDEIIGLLRMRQENDGQADSKHSAGSETPDDAGAQPDKPGQAPGSLQRKTAIEEALESQTEHGGIGEQLKEVIQAGTEPDEQVKIAAPVDNADMAATGYTQQSITAHSGLVARLSSRLQGLLQARDLKPAMPGTAGNRLARNRLHRIKTGDPKLFLRKAPQKAVNTAIHLLVDNSTSMAENQRFQITRDVTLALVKSLANMRGVNLAVTVFPAHYPYGRRGIPAAPVVAHGSKPGSSILYPGRPKGQTPLHAAVRYAASVMAGLCEPRKIMLILSDGDPDDVADAGLAIQEAYGMGIEIVCLGIEDVVVRDIFPHFEIVGSVQDLPEKAFALLEGLLTEKTSRR